MPTPVLSLESLKQAVAQGAALRFRARLQPAGGHGDKVFPPTYEGGKYAEEKRRIPGHAEPVPCVHLDSVQSQANRMELALLEASREGRLPLPIVQVVFDEDLAEVGTITSMEAPHRLADAILRDSTLNGVRFRMTEEGKTLDSASLQNATGLFGIAPTSLLFGLWDSTGPKGGLGVKFQRAIVSELVGVDAVVGQKSSSRIDPLGIVLNAGPIYLTNKTTGEWGLNENDASGKPLSKMGKEGKPSEANHGNVTPSITHVNGGVTFDHALQTLVISLPALRRLRFPLGGNQPTQDVDLTAQTTLAALGLAAAALSIAKGTDLRSRCLLVPEAPPTWEIVKADGQIEAFTLTADEACTLLEGAVKAAETVGLPWRKEPLTLQPSAGLAQLVRKSRELAMQTKAED